MTRTVAQAVVARVSDGIGALGLRPRHGLRVLMYHAIGAPSPGASGSLSVPRPLFEAQLRWLRESGLPLVPLPQAALAPGGRPATTEVAVTFDDGYRDVLDVAAPVLAALRVPFTVFVVGGYLTQPPAAGCYLDRVALCELSAVPGVTIGAHGHTHRPLTRLDDRDLARELRASAAAVGDAIGVAPVTMSYPHGAVDRRVAEEAAAAGFRVAATSLIGVNRAGGSPLRLRRTEVTAADTELSFRGRISGAYDWYQLKQRMYWPVPRT